MSRLDCSGIVFSETVTYIHGEPSLSEKLKHSVEVFEHQHSTQNVLKWEEGTADGVRVVMQLVKPPLTTLTSCIREASSVSGKLAFNPASCQCAYKAAGDGPPIRVGGQVSSFSLTQTWLL